MLAATLLALAVVAYTYVGYPLAIAVLARLAPRRAAADPSHGRAGPGDGPAKPGDAGPGSKMVSVCLPVRDGAATLAAKVESLLGQSYPAHLLEILIYCDGCRDDSEATARSLAAAPTAAGRIRVLASGERRGKPSALNALAAAARGELLLLNDVRQPLSPNAIQDLAAALADPTVGCATGQLCLTGEAGSGVYWRYERWIRAQESRFRGVVGMTGALAMMRRADFVPLPADLILDDVWIPMRLALAGRRVASVETAQAYDVAFEDEREFGRKVRTLSGNYQLFRRMPSLLVPFANPIWFETFSHKVLRLAVPWLLLALLPLAIAGARGAGPAGLALGLVLIGQIVFYLLAAAGPRLGGLGRLARTFVVLNGAAVVGLWRHLTGRQPVTW
jgi:cellulose synthase/poly-beta-1,6-N-acetylglucosamine synthase-like glycosyltransferase